MDTFSLEPQTDMSRIGDAMERIRTEIARVVVGQDEVVELMLCALLAEGHILLEGVPGVAKTLTAKLLARSIDVGFSRIQFTPDLMPSDVMGTNVFDPRQAVFSFRPGPIFSHIILIDEINRAPAKTQAALFEVMEERTITVDGISHPLSEPFMVMATQNPVEHEGTYALPEAQLDRFMFKIAVGYPSLEQEVDILQRHQSRHNLHRLDQDIQKVIDAKDLASLRVLASEVRVEPRLLQYIAEVVQQTRTHSGLVLGASPRASVAILHASKALAALRGRDFVQPEDIVTVALPALRHRVMLSAEKEMEGVSTDSLLRGLLAQVEVPR
jgi:MoxR-like ATPase